MNFLVVTPNVSLSSLDAQGVHVTEITNSLVEIGHNVYIFAASTPESNNFQNPIHFISTTSSGGVFPTLLRELNLIRDLYKTYLTQKIDVVIYIRQYLLCFFPAMLGRFVQIPVIIEVNGMYLEDRRLSKAYPDTILKFPFIFRIVEHILRLIINFGYILADGVIVVAPGLIKYLNEHHKVPLDKIKYCPNGVNIKNFQNLDDIQCRERLGLSREKKYLGFIGSLTPWQGIDCVIKALASLIDEFPDLDLLIVGDGEKGKELKLLVDKLHLSKRVFFEGAVSHSKARLFTGAVDYTVAPYTLKWPRSEVMAVSGVKIPESLAAGSPIIVSKLPGLEFIENERVGYLAKPDDIAGWTEVLRSALHIDEYDYKAMSNRARLYAESNRSWIDTARCISQFVGNF